MTYDSRKAAEEAARRDAQQRQERSTKNMLPEDAKRYEALISHNQKKNGW